MSDHAVTATTDGSDPATIDMPIGARILLGECDDLPMSGWAMYRLNGKWHQILDVADMVRFPCMSVVVPRKTVVWHDYRAHFPANGDVCRRPHCQREVQP